VVPVAVELFVEKRGENGLGFFIALEGVVDARVLAPADAIPVRYSGRRSDKDRARELTGVVWGGWRRDLVVVLDSDCWNVHETCGREKRVQGDTFSVEQGTFSRAGWTGCRARCLSAVQDAVSVEQDTLDVVQVRRARYFCQGHVLLSLP